MRKRGNGGEKIDLDYTSTYWSDTRPHNWQALPAIEKLINPVAKVQNRRVPVTEQQIDSLRGEARRQTGDCVSYAPAVTTLVLLYSYPTDIGELFSPGRHLPCTGT